MHRFSGSFIVSFDFQPPDKAVMIVGKQSKERGMEVINAFTDETARELYTKLTTQEDEKDGV